MADPNVSPAEPQKSNFENFKIALKEISFAGGLLVFIITSLTSLSLSGVLTVLLEGGFSLDGEGLLLLFKTIRLTAPLTAGVAIVAYALWRKWIDSFFYTGILGAGVFALTSVLLQKNGQNLILNAWEEKPSGNVAISFLVSLLKQYFLLYTWAPFLSSLLIGIFLAWALHRLHEASKPS